MRYLRIVVSTIYLIVWMHLTMGSVAVAQPLKIGITGGITVTTHLHNFRYVQDDIDLELNPEPAMGYSGGLVIRQDLGPSIRIQAEPTVTLFGARYNEPFMLRGFEFETDSRSKLLYLQLPLLLQFSTVPPSRTVFGRPFAQTSYHFTTGLFGGYLLDAQFSGTNTGELVGVPFEGDFSNDVTPQYDEFDGGLILGLGLEHGYNNKIGFEMRGALSVFDSGHAPGLNFKHQNAAVYFALYYLF